MAESERLQAGVHDAYAAEAQRLGVQLRERASETVREILAEHAQAVARDRDDNHVGTEHVVLGIYRSEQSAARALLENAGVSRERFELMLDDEAGPSPEGHIPYTIRSMMIGGLAVRAADALGSAEVNDVHLLLGVLAESTRWEQQHDWGPHHLRAALVASGGSPGELEAAAHAAIALA